MRPCHCPPAGNVLGHELRKLNGEGMDRRVRWAGRATEGKESTWTATAPGGC